MGVSQTSLLSTTKTADTVTAAEDAATILEVTLLLGDAYFSTILTPRNWVSLRFPIA
jgi:hypothetical protein